MTIYLDADYLSLAPLLRPECQRRDIPMEVIDLNSQGWGDVMFTDWNGKVHSGEIKGASEILGSLDHVELQLSKQLENCDHAFLAIYGYVEQDPRGDCYSLTPYGKESYVYSSEESTGVQRTFKRRTHRQNYLGYRAKMARFSELGVEVFEVPDLPHLAVQLISLYNNAQHEGSTFRRIVRERITVAGIPSQRKNLMLAIMGIPQAEIGEEMADAIVTGMETVGQEPNLLTLVTQLCKERDGDCALFFETLPLRSGKRRVGPAAVTRLKKALGVL